MYKIKFKVHLLETKDMLTLALGSSMLSFTGMGTLSSNFCSSSFSSCHEERQVIENPQGNGQGKKLSSSQAGVPTPVPKHSSAHLSHSDVLELWGQGEHSEKLNLTQGGFQQLVVGLHSVIGDIVVTSYPAKFCHLERRKTQCKAD